MKKIFYILTTFIIICTFSILGSTKRAIADTAPALVYVNASWAGTTIGEDPDGNGPATRFGYDSFATIQEGVNNVASGGTVQVAAGTYDEAVKISQQLTLVGEAGAIIKPDNNTPLYDQGVRRAAIYISEANGVTIDGFEIDGTGGVVHYGVYGFNANDATVKNMNIHHIVNAVDAPVYDVAGVGILFFGWGQGEDNLKIEDNTIKETGRMGIFIGGMQSETPYKFLASNSNVISQNTVTKAWQGPTNGGGGAIQINGAKNCTIASNKVSQTGIQQFGIYLYGSASTASVISDNELSDNPSGVVIWSDGGGVDFGSDAIQPPTVEGNQFTLNTVQVKDYSDSPYISDIGKILAQNTFDRAVTVDHPGSSLLPTIWSSIQDGVKAAMDGDSVNVAAGTYVEGPQVVISKNISLVGAGRDVTIIKPSADTGDTGDARGWFLVNTGITFNMSKVTMDGEGQKIYQALRHLGSGTISDCAFENVKYDTYRGFGIAVMGDGNVTVDGCSFMNMQRIGTIFYGKGVTDSTFSHNTYQGKGAGDWLDYAVEVGAGAHVTITDNDISGNLGVASTDGSTSAGVLVTTYYGDGTQANVTNNNFTGNTDGIAVGYDSTDTSSVTAEFNSFVNNSKGINTTAPVVNAKNNWWDSLLGPTNNSNPGGNGQVVSDNVTFDPWLCDGTDAEPDTVGFQPASEAGCTAAQPTTLIFSTQPGSAVFNQPLNPQPVVEALAGGDRSVTFNGNVSLGLYYGGVGAHLKGTTTVKAVNGVASFSGLSIDKPGKGYALLAYTSYPLLAVFSNPFDINGWMYYLPLISR